MKPAPPAGFGISGALASLTRRTVMLIKRRIHLAIDIAQGGKAPTEFRMFASGWNDTLKGLYLYDLPASLSVMQAFATLGNRLTFYFGHPELDGRKPEDCRSAGSFLIENRGSAENPECWMHDIQWADGVAEAIERREWLYISQAFAYDPESRRVLEVYNCALTNEPATKNARPLLMAASRMEALGMSHEQIRSILQGLIDRIFPESEHSWNYVRDVFDDNVVFEHDGKLLQVNYAVDAGGAPTLVGGAIEVMIAYQPVPQTQGLGSIPYRAGPIDDTPGWNRKAAELSVRKWATKPDGTIDMAKYGKAFAYVDSSAPDVLASYKLIHHEVQAGELVVSRPGTMAAGGACMGQRGGVDIPEKDMPAVKDHLGKHYKAFDDVAPWDVAQQQSSRSQSAGDSGAAGTERKTLMDKSFLSALGLPETAPDTQALAELTKVVAHLDNIKKLTGKDDAEAAIGVLTSWREASEKLPTVQADLAKVEKAKERDGVVQLLDKAQSEKRLTPDERSTYLADYDAGTLSAAWLNGRIPNKPVNQVLAGTGTGSADAAVSTDANPPPAGKKWAELSAMEKHNLYLENRPAYEALKAEHAKSQGK